jgi:hypothetical protein
MVGTKKSLRKFFGTGKTPDPNKGSDSRIKFKAGSQHRSKTPGEAKRKTRSRSGRKKRRSS